MRYRGVRGDVAAHCRQLPHPRRARTQRHAGRSVRRSVPVRPEHVQQERQHREDDGVPHNLCDDGTCKGDAGGSAQFLGLHTVLARRTQPRDAHASHLPGSECHPSSAVGTKTGQQSAGALTVRTCYYHMHLGVP